MAIGHGQAGQRDDAHQQDPRRGDQRPVQLPALAVPGTPAREGCRTGQIK